MSTKRSSKREKKGPSTAAFAAIMATLLTVMPAAAVPSAGGPSEATPTTVPLDTHDNVTEEAGETVCGEGSVAVILCPLSESWVARYDGGPADGASDAAVGPDGQAVYVTGSRYGGVADEWATVAYDGATGEQLWIAHQESGSFPGAEASELVVSSNGSMVLVTGTNDLGWQGGGDVYQTVAYNATTGDEVWTATFEEASTLTDPVLSLGPDDETVYMAAGTPHTDGWSSRPDMLVQAYDAATGEERWTAQYGADDDDVTEDVEVGPDGDTVYVTGWSWNGQHYDDYRTLAYDAHTGDLLWNATYDSPIAGGNDNARALSVGPDGTSVFVTGWSKGPYTYVDYATVGYDSETGAELWSARYDGPGVGDDFVADLEVGPDGDAVYVTGRSNTLEYQTLAYDTETGEELWPSIDLPDGTSAYMGAYDSGYPDWARSLELSPDGEQIYVTGESMNERQGIDFATVVVDATTGATSEAARYSTDTEADREIARDLAVSPDGDTVIVTGESRGNGIDAATVAYDATALDPSSPIPER